MVKIENIETLVQEILVAEEIPFSQIGVNGNNALKLILAHVWEKYQIDWKMVDRDKTEELMLSIIVKVVLENFFLHTRHLMLVGNEENEL